MIYRHGDLPIQKTDKIMGTEVKHNGTHVLAFGEQTGHSHVITAEPSTMRIYKVDETTWCLDLSAPATITHEEHKTIVLAPDKYIVGREREYCWFTHATRKVVD